jgi:beta-glucanase (GH16 family)
LRLTAEPVTCNGTSASAAGAIVSTNPSDGVPGHTGYQFTYGFAEYRVYLPATPAGQVANWPGVWTDGQVWPNDGENDVMEGLGGNACFHFHSLLGGPGNCPAASYTGWHTFAADWEPGVVTYYYDGAQVGQIATGITSSPMYVLADLSVGSPSVVPSDMLVDWVRVWQH